MIFAILEEQPSLNLLFLASFYVLLISEFLANYFFSYSQLSDITDYNLQWQLLKSWCQAQVIFENTSAPTLLRKHFGYMFHR